MERFGKKLVAGAFMGTAVIYPGGHAAILTVGGNPPVVAAAYDRPVHLAQPGGRNLENVVRFEGITVSSSAQAVMFKTIFAKPVFKS